MSLEQQIEELNKNLKQHSKDLSAFGDAILTYSMGTAKLNQTMPKLVEALSPGAPAAKGGDTPKDVKPKVKDVKPKGKSKDKKVETESTLAEVESTGAAEQGDLLGAEEVTAEDLLKKGQEYLALPELKGMSKAETKAAIKAVVAKHGAELIRNVPADKRASCRNAIQELIDASKAGAADDEDMI
jgi:hypothetical protein